MSNAVYKGKTYSASYYEDMKPNSIMIRSKHEQEEEGFMPASNHRGYYKYVNPNEIDEYYGFHFYAVFGEAKCYILGMTEDMERMAFEERGTTLIHRFAYSAQIDRDCYLYNEIPVKAADSFILKLEYREKPEFKRTCRVEEITMTCEKFLETYCRFVTDVF